MILMVKRSKRKGFDSQGKPASLSEAPSPSSVFFGRPAVHLLIIVILGILVYANTFNVPFAFDDFSAVVENPRIQDLRHYFDSSLANYTQMRFIGYFSFALNYKLSGSNVIGFHAFNLLVHLINALLVYGILYLTIKTSVARESDQKEILKTSSLCYWIPLFTALLFVCHPVQTQAVTYIVQRFASLATLFYLLSLLLYIQSRNSVSRPARYSFYAAAFLSAVLAMKTKEIAFTLPVMIILYEFMFFKGSIKKRILRLATFLLTMLIIPLLMIWSQGGAFSVGAIDKITRSGGFVDMSRWDYLFTQFRVIVTYIRLLFFPINQNLDYDYPIYRSFFNPEVFLSFLFLLALFGLGIYLLFKSYRAEKNNSLLLRMVSFGLIWFFVTLSVESSIIPITDVIFEHRLYLPSAGFFIALVSGIILIKEHLAIRAPVVARVTIPMLILVVVVLSVTAYARNMVWQDDGTLWADVIKKSPFKSRPHNNMALYYHRKERFDEAIKSYRTAIRLKPDYAEAYYNLGILYQKQSRFEEAVISYQAVLKHNPNYAEVYNNLGVLYQTKGHFDEAIKAYQQALKLKPDLVMLYQTLGILYQTQGGVDEAVKAYQMALKLTPDNFTVYNNLGLLYQTQGRHEEALRSYQVALKLKPDYTDAHYNIGLLYQIQGRLAEAIQSYRAAINYQPNNAEARNNLGGVYAQQGRLAEAVGEFQTVLKIDPNHKGARNNLKTLNEAMKKSRIK